MHRPGWSPATSDKVLGHPTLPTAEDAMSAPLGAFARWLRTFTTPTNKNARRRSRRSPKPPRRFVPHVELLETRCLPANIAWTGNGDGIWWSDSDNWDALQVPGQGDDVANASGDIQLSGAVQVNSLALSGGSLSGGSLTVQTLTWTGGLLATDTLVEDTLTINGSADKELDGAITLTNAGSGSWSDAGSVWMYDGATFVNASGATFDIQINGWCVDGGGDPSTFVNAGTLIKSSGASTASLEIAFTNSGLVEVQSGTLELTGGGSASGTVPLPEMFAALAA
jgi:hypothetical protein